MFWLKEDKEDVTKANVEPSKYLVMACQPIVDCLIENINKTYLTLFIELFLLLFFFNESAVTLRLYTRNRSERGDIAAARKRGNVLRGRGSLFLLQTSFYKKMLKPIRQ
jgi:hypothetical protein